MPMPIDILIVYKDGTRELHYIPLDLMFGGKPKEGEDSWIQHKEWQWTAPEYTFEIPRKIFNIKSIEIDPSQRMADINRVNNRLVNP